MPAPVECPRCGAELDIPAELLRNPVRCAACQTVFTPDDGGADPRDNRGRARGETVRPRDDGRLPGQPRDDRDPYFDPAARRARRDTLDARDGRQGRGCLIFAILGGLSISACCVGLIGLGVWGAKMADPELVAYTAPDGSFTASFPGAPTVGTVPPVPPGRSATTYEWQRLILGQPLGVWRVAVTDLKGEPTERERKKLLETAFDEFRALPQARERCKLDALLGGAPAKEVDLALADGDSALARAAVIGSRLYVVSVSGKNLEPGNNGFNQQRVRAFWESFRAADADKPGDADDAPKPAKGKKPPEPDADE